MGIFEKLQARLELYRLEQRYTRREKRTTFYSDAQYVDGEYVYTIFAQLVNEIQQAFQQDANNGHQGAEACRKRTLVSAVATVMP